MNKLKAFLLLGLEWNSLSDAAGWCMDTIRAYPDLQFMVIN